MVLDVINSARVSASVLEGLGLLVTAWRIYFRLRIRRFWWEDAFAVIVLFTGLLWITAEWIYLLTDGLTSIITWWIYSIGYICILAFAHMSILFSIVRIAWGSPRLLKFTCACVALFVACWVLLVTKRVRQCASDPTWHQHEVAFGAEYCNATPEVSMIDFTTECVVISILVALPLRMLWRVKLSKRRRRMILSVFASTGVLAFAALFHILGRMLSIYAVAIIGMHVEVTSSLFVCNLLVVVTYVYRHCIHPRTGYDTTARTSESQDTSPDVDDDDFTTPMVQTTTMDLTTIDLDMPSGCHTMSVSKDE